MDRRIAAFSLIELIALVGVVAITLLLILPQFTTPPRRAPRIKCVNNLKNIGLAFRIFATDNDDRYPGANLASNRVNFATVDIVTVFQFLTNELSTPIILYCPTDKKRRMTDSFTNFTAKNISYFASLSADQTLSAALLAGDRHLQTDGVPVSSGLFTLTTNAAISWSKDVHNETGNVAVADGTVQMLNSAGLIQTVRSQALATNHLIIP